MGEVSYVVRLRRDPGLASAPPWKRIIMWCIVVVRVFFPLCQGGASPDLSHARLKPHVGQILTNHFIFHIPHTTRNITQMKQMAKSSDAFNGLAMGTKTLV